VGYCPRPIRAVWAQHAAPAHHQGMRIGPQRWHRELLTPGRHCDIRCRRTKRCSLPATYGGRAASSLVLSGVNGIRCGGPREYRRNRFRGPVVKTRRCGSVFSPPSQPVFDSRRSQPTRFRGPLLFVRGRDTFASDREQAVRKGCSRSVHFEAYQEGCKTKYCVQSGEVRHGLQQVRNAASRMSSQPAE